MAKFNQEGQTVLGNQINLTSSTMKMKLEDLKIKPEDIENVRSIIKSKGGDIRGKGDFAIMMSYLIDKHNELIEYLEKRDEH